MYARENGCQWNASFICTIAAGEYLLLPPFLSPFHLLLLFHIYLSIHLLTSFPGNGHLECLKYARDNGGEWGETIEAAVRGGHLACLRYAREAGCPRPWNLDQLQGILLLISLLSLLHPFPRLPPLFLSLADTWHV